MFPQNWSWPARVTFVAALGFIASSVIYPIFGRARESCPPPSCSSHLKQIGLALAQYEQDYDNDFPPIISGGAAYGWADAIQPYIKSTDLYHCPLNKPGGQPDSLDPDPRRNGYIDYPFNAKLGKKSRDGLEEVAWQITALDGNDGREVTNARYCLTEIPPLWFQQENSPIHRHYLQSGNYLFADGHVKALTNQQYFRDKRLLF